MKIFYLSLAFYLLLTSISVAQFWPRSPLSQNGLGAASGATTVSFIPGFGVFDNKQTAVKFIHGFGIMRAQ